jgi:hypothetical protein
MQKERRDCCIVSSHVSLGNGALFGHHPVRMGDGHIVQDEVLFNSPLVLLHR